MKSLSQRDYSAKKHDYFAKEVRHHVLSLTADKLLIQCSAHKVERLS